MTTLSGGVKAGGVFKFDVIRDGKVIDSFEEHNLVVDEGLNYILDVALSAGSQLTSFYVSLFKTARTPQPGDTMSGGFSATTGEINGTDVSEVVRETWTEAGVTNQTITNGASPAEFNFSANTNIEGAMLVAGSNSFGGTTGTLIAAARFGATRNMLAGDILSVTYAFNIADA